MRREFPRGIFDLIPWPDGVGCAAGYIPRAKALLENELSIFLVFLPDGFVCVALRILNTLRLRFLALRQKSCGICTVHFQAVPNF